MFTVVRPFQFSFAPDKSPFIRKINTLQLDCHTISGFVAMFVIADNNLSFILSFHIYRSCRLYLKMSMAPFVGTPQRRPLTVIKSTVLINKPVLITWLRLYNKWKYGSTTIKDRKHSTSIIVIFSTRISRIRRHSGAHTSPPIYYTVFGQEDCW